MRAGIVVLKDKVLSAHRGDDNWQDDVVLVTLRVESSTDDDGSGSSPVPHAGPDHHTAASEPIMLSNAASSVPFPGHSQNT